METTRKLIRSEGLCYLYEETETKTDGYRWWVVEGYDSRDRSYRFFRDSLGNAELLFLAIIEGLPNPRK